MGNSLTGKLREVRDLLRILEAGRAGLRRELRAIRERVRRELREVLHRVLRLGDELRLHRGVLARERGHAAECVRHHLLHRGLALRPRGHRVKADERVLHRGGGGGGGLGLGIGRHGHGSLVPRQ